MLYVRNHVLYMNLLLLFFAVAKNARNLQDNLQKLQRERQELQDLMMDTITEVTSQGTFSTLSDWITRNHEEKLNMERTILK